MTDKQVNKPILLAIKCGRQQYNITEADRFMDNGLCIQLITQKGPFVQRSYTTPRLPKREVKRISALKRIEHAHKLGETVRIFSLHATTEQKDWMMTKMSSTEVFRALLADAHCQMDSCNHRGDVCRGAYIESRGLYLDKEGNWTSGIEGDANWWNTISDAKSFLREARFSECEKIKKD